METGLIIIVVLTIAAIMNTSGGSSRQIVKGTSTVASSSSFVLPSVNLTDRDIIYNFILRKTTSDISAENITANILQYSKEFSVDPKLVAALISRESGFNPRAVSSSGAIGLGQLLPQTANFLGIDDPFDPGKNILGTAKYLKFQLDRFNNTENQIELALASYAEGYYNIINSGGIYSEKTAKYIDDILNIYRQLSGN
jgi:hypothetical protein